MSQLFLTQINIKTAYRNEIRAVSQWPFFYKQRNERHNSGQNKVLECVYHSNINKAAVERVRNFMFMAYITDDCNFIMRSP